MIEGSGSRARSGSLTAFFNIYFFVILLLPTPGKADPDLTDQNQFGFIHDADPDPQHCSGVYIKQPPPGDTKHREGLAPYLYSILLGKFPTLPLDMKMSPSMARVMPICAASRSDQSSTVSSRSVSAFVRM